MKRYLIFLILFLLFSGCQTYYNPVLQKEEYTFYSEKDEIFIGKSADEKLSKEYKISIAPENIQRIGKKIASVCDRANLEYIFKVVENEEINAFSIPGGYVYLYEGLIEKVKDEDEIAFVIAHEIGHICARDGIQRLEKTILYSIPASILLSGDKNKVIKQAIDVGFNISMLKYSRQQELRADSLAIKYLIKGGFNPEKSIKFFETLKEMEKNSFSGMFTFLRDHPPLEERIKNVRQAIEEYKTSFR